MASRRTKTAKYAAPGRNDRTDSFLAFAICSSVVCHAAGTLYANVCRVRVYKKCNSASVRVSLDIVYGKCGLCRVIAFRNRRRTRSARAVTNSSSATGPRLCTAVVMRIIVVRSWWRGWGGGLVEREGRRRNLSAVEEQERRFSRLPDDQRDKY